MGSRAWQVVGGTALGLLIGWAAYNAGLSQGAAEAAAATGAAPADLFRWGVHRHWGFGFPFGFLLLWVIIARGLFWGGPWRRRWHYYRDDVPPSFDELHRRAHEQMGRADSDRR
jgi:hypothetical protein